MLKGINPLLGGDLLRVLDHMGHGDRLLIVDRNYPAHASERKVISILSDSIIEVSRAILSVFPLDTFVSHPVERMEVEDDPRKTTPVQTELLRQVSSTYPRISEFRVIPRLDFYEKAK